MGHGNVLPTYGVWRTSQAGRAGTSPISAVSRLTSSKARGVPGPRKPGHPSAAEIGQLTDVSDCNLQHHFLCNQHHPCPYPAKDPPDEHDGHG